MCDVRVEPYNNDVCFKGKSSYTYLLNVGVTITKESAVLVYFDDKIVTITLKDVEICDAQPFPNRDFFILTTSTASYIVQISTKKMHRIEFDEKNISSVFVCIPLSEDPLENCLECYFANACQLQEADEGVYQYDDGKIIKVAESDVHFVHVYTKNNNTYIPGEQMLRYYFNEQDTLEICNFGFFLNMNGERKQILIEAEAYLNCIESSSPTAVFLSKNKTHLYYFGDSMIVDNISFVDFCENE